ncbi:hypothetical protein C0991_005180 [Blastosporella zonata]|nr:hypothetical protein C0991_005180 [Blastosporella zonata]
MFIPLPGPSSKDTSHDNNNPVTPSKRPSLIPGIISESIIPPKDVISKISQVQVEASAVVSGLHPHLPSAGDISLPHLPSPSTIRTQVASVVQTTSENIQSKLPSTEDLLHLPSESITHAELQVSETIKAQISSTDDASSHTSVFASREDSGEVSAATDVHSPGLSSIPASMGALLGTQLPPLNHPSLADVKGKLPVSPVSSVLPPIKNLLDTSSASIHQGVSSITTNVDATVGIVSKEATSITSTAGSAIGLVSHEVTSVTSTTSSVAGLVSQEASSTTGSLIGLVSKGTSSLASTAGSVVGVVSKEATTVTSTAGSVVGLVSKGTSSLTSTAGSLAGLVSKEATTITSTAGSVVGLVSDAIPPQLSSLGDLPKKMGGELSHLSDVALSAEPLSSKLTTFASSPLISKIPGMGLISEVTPLLQLTVKKIPWFQVSIILFLQVVEPLTTHVVSPFTPELIRNSVGNIGTDEQLDYVAGLLKSLFYFVEASTVLYWSKSSDKVGRKPVILIGLIGSILSMMCFGISQSLWGTLISLSLITGLNGNTGVIKGMMAEMVDTKDLARIYAFTPLAYSAGAAVGPIINGYLSHSTEKAPAPESVSRQAMVPNLFVYLFASSVPTMLSIASFVVTFLFLKETVKSPAPVSTLLRVPPPAPVDVEHFHVENPREILSVVRQKSTAAVQDGLALGGTVAAAVASRLPVDPRNLLSLRALLANMPVIIAVGNFGCLSLVDITFRTIQPLFLASPMSLGGLGLPPNHVEKILSAYGVLNGVVQLMFFTKIYDRLGPRKTFIYGVASAIPLFLMFPITSFLAKTVGHGVVLWLALSAQIVLPIGFSLAFGSIFMYITASAPNPESLGTTNGLSQMLANAVRGIGPGIATGLFKASMTESYIGGGFVYLVLALMAAGATVAAWFLPQKLWSKGPIPSSHLL